jgi:hypothetical protein
MSLKVRYHDGRMQVLEADRYESQTDYWRFTRDDQEIALIAKQSVESITNNDVPDPELPEAGITEMHRAEDGRGFSFSTEIPPIPDSAASSRPPPARGFVSG